MQNRSRASRALRRGVVPTACALLLACSPSFALPESPFSAVSVSRIAVFTAPTTARVSVAPTGDRSRLALGDGVEFAPTFSGPATLVENLRTGASSPISLASDDFDGDGVKDLACGYTAAGGGAIAVFRGNVRSIYPRPGSLGDEPPLHPNAALHAVPGVPDFLVAGDFDNDGTRDLAAASRGASRIWLMSGDGRGGFAAPRTIELPGGATAMAAGEVNRADGLPDLVVAVDGTAGPRLLVFEGPDGAVRAEPEVLQTSAPVTSLLTTQIDGRPEFDIAAAAGNDLLVVHGRDRKLLAGAAGADTTAPPVSRRSFDAQVRSISAGDFSGAHRRGLAVLLETGELRVVEPSDLRDDVAQWTESARHGGIAAGASLARARVSALPSDDLLVLEPAASRIVAVGNANEFSAFERAPVLDTAGAPVAALSMRLNADALPDLVVIVEGRIVPSILLTRGAVTFTVTNTNDSGLGSLRQAILDANASAGADLIDFNIPGAAPAVRIISPTSALPQITDPVTVDATTQPGYAGTPLVELRGDNAGIGSSGLHVLAGSSLVRGLAVSGFRVDEENFIGGIGILLENGGGNVVDACFGGTDASGTVDRPNEIANVQIYESADNLIGGTVAEARNLLTGSCRSACLEISFSELAAENLIKGNYVGTDVTGTLDLNNLNYGVALFGGPNNVVGGTEPGARNVLSGNGADFVGANLVIAGERNSIVQGNFIGTDPTGTVAVATNPARSLLIDDTAVDNLIGGTAEGAPNLIGFNVYGVQVGENGLSTGNAILRNVIRGHESPGLDLGYDFVTPNDAGDGDAGANNLQNTPVLTSASTTSETVTINGRLDSRPNTAYRIEFFANAECNPFGSGEGETFLGAMNVQSNAAGAATFETSFEGMVAPGNSITATATDPDGNTSEFSMCVELALSWMPPDPSAGLNPPRNLTVRLASQPAAPATDSEPAKRRDDVMGYNVYRSNQPGVQATPANLFTSLPPNQTSANANVFVGGTFFVVTAVYPNGESPPSNEVETGVPPEVTSVKVQAKKVVAKGSGFTDSVLVTVDGIPFVAQAAVKKAGKKVIQKGNLLTGQSVVDYARSRGGTVTVLYRNSTGGVEGRRVTVP